MCAVGRVGCAGGGQLGVRKCEGQLIQASGLVGFQVAKLSPNMNSVYGTRQSDS